MSRNSFLDHTNKHSHKHTNKHSLLKEISDFHLINHAEYMKDYQNQIFNFYNIEHESFRQFKSKHDHNIINFLQNINDIFDNLIEKYMNIQNDIEEIDISDDIYKAYQAISPYLDRQHINILIFADRKGNNLYNLENIYLTQFMNTLYVEILYKYIQYVKDVYDNKILSNKQKINILYIIQRIFFYFEENALTGIYPLDDSRFEHDIGLYKYFSCKFKNKIFYYKFGIYNKILQAKLEKYRDILDNNIYNEVPEFKTKIEEKDEIQLKCLSNSHIMILCNILIESLKISQNETLKRRRSSKSSSLDERMYKQYKNDGKGIQGGKGLKQSYVFILNKKYKVYNGSKGGHYIRKKNNNGNIVKRYVKI